MRRARGRSAARAGNLKQIPGIGHLHSSALDGPTQLGQDEVQRIVRDVQGLIFVAQVNPPAGLIGTEAVGRTSHLRWPRELFRKSWTWISRLSSGFPAAADCCLAAAKSARSCPIHAMISASVGPAGAAGGSFSVPGEKTFCILGARFQPYALRDGRAGQCPEEISGASPMKSWRAISGIFISGCG